MTEQLEAEVRAALRERAAQVPAASIARLTHVDYQPRTRRLRPPLTIGAFTAAAAGAAGAAAVIVSLTAGASNAFAGWTPAPTPPAPNQLAVARADCQTQSPIAGLPLKLMDTRGPFTFSVYADSMSNATCIKGPTFTAVSGSASSAPVDVPAGHILLSTHATSQGGAAYSFADGRAGAGVSAVTLVLDDGTKVQSTVANGWFVAWWPSTHAVTAAQITTPAGMTTQTVPATPIRCGSAPRCAASGSDIGGGPAGAGVSVTGFAGGEGAVQGGSAQSYSRSR